jgi:hypothetical protein
MRAITLLPTVFALLAAQGALALDCSVDAERELRRLGLADHDVDEIRYVEKLNPTERGPDVLGVRAWVRPLACDSGYLVIDMTRSCFVRQSYTRGGCRLDGVTAY